MQWVDLINWLGLCFCVAAIGGWWTAREIDDWYRSLARPSFAPPDWVFGPMWALLYALMAIAAWQVSLAPHSANRSLALDLFLVQLALNLAWSWFFFHRHAMGTALAEAFLLLAAVGATTLLFAGIAPIAAWLMAPYWAWVTFATVLNGAFWHLN